MTSFFTVFAKHATPFTKEEGFAEAAQVGGVGSILFGAFTLNDLAVLVGLFTAFVGFAAQLYFGIRRERRERELHRARMAAIAGLASVEKEALDAKDDAD